MLITGIPTWYQVMVGSGTPVMGQRSGTVVFEAAYTVKLVRLKTSAGAPEKCTHPHTHTVHTTARSKHLHAGILRNACSI